MYQIKRKLYTVGETIKDGNEITRNTEIDFKPPDSVVLNSDPNIKIGHVSSIDTKEDGIWITIHLKKQYRNKEFSEFIGKDMDLTDSIWRKGKVEKVVINQFYLKILN